MYYNYLRYKIRNEADRARAIDNLIALRARLDAEVPAKDSEDNILVATWNVRDFGKPTRKRRGWGARLPETWFYIAEVISRFDIVAVQEINELPEWKHVMDILGRDWEYIATDVTDSRLGGNGERMAFVYDRRKVWFRNIAGEIVLPPKMLISRSELEVHGKTVTAGSQFKRTPFVASFQSGWLRFDLCTVHLYYGESSGEKLEQRIEEIATIAKYFGRRAEDALKEDRALLLLGDFNIVSPRHRTMEALESNGFTVPEVLKENPTTGSKKHYDQIGFVTKPEVLEYVEKRRGSLNNRNAGVFQLFESVMTDKQFSDYRNVVATKSSAGKKASNASQLLKAYRSWRTYQFSDHFPMWVRLETDGSAAYLERQARRLRD